MQILTGQKGDSKMDQILVLYKSKYGATKKYAAMLQKELSCEILDIKDFKKAVLTGYDCIIFAGSIYANGISGLNILRKHYSDFKEKKLAVFCVGASPYDEKSLEKTRLHNLKGDCKDIPLFYGRGAWDESSMSLKDRALCKMLQKMIAKQDPDSYEPWMEALLSASVKTCDWTDRTYLLPLLKYIRAKEEP